MTTTSPHPPAAAAPPRPGCGPPTWPPSPASGCGPASCAPGCRRWASRSASRAIVAVLGLAASSQAALLAEIPALGTNLLTVTNGQTLTGATAELPEAAPGMIARLPGVTGVQDTGSVTGVNVYRVPAHPLGRYQRPQRGRRHPGPARAWPAPALAQGQFLNAATAREPVAVLGAATPRSCWASTGSGPGLRIWARRPVVLRRPASSARHTYAPEIDSAVLVGFPAAEQYLRLRRAPVGNLRPHRRTPRPPPPRVDSLLGAQANPENPSQVNVSQPSDALTAQADAKGALDTLFLGLGAVALLVGAIGVANIMVISVLERRSEIGLRRALGATRGQIRAQFLAEAILLSLAGGVAGVVIGAAATAAYARSHGEAVVIPPEAWAGGLAAALLIGALAGLLPAIRAARLSPTQALWSI